LGRRQLHKLYREALATLDEGKRCEIIKQMQAIDFEQGGSSSGLTTEHDLMRVMFAALAKADRVLAWQLWIQQSVLA